jgi:hypothetical protein
LTLSAREYIDHFLDSLSTSLLVAYGISRLEVTDALVNEDDTTAVLEVAILFDRGEELHIHITADVSPGWPMWPHYSFHLQASDGTSITRLDNTPHYRDVPTFPDHQHIGPSEVVQPLDNNSLRNIIELVSSGISHDRGE